MTMRVKRTLLQNQELTRVKKKVSSGVSGTTNTLQEAEKRPSLNKGKGIMTEVQGTGQTSFTLQLIHSLFNGLQFKVSSTVTGKEFIRPQGSEKAKRSCPFSPNRETISRRQSKATGK